MKLLVWFVCLKYNMLNMVIRVLKGNKIKHRDDTSNGRRLLLFCWLCLVLSLVSWFYVASFQAWRGSGVLSWSPAAGPDSSSVVVFKTQICSAPERVVSRTACVQLCCSFLPLFGFHSVSVICICILTLSFLCPLMGPDSGRHRLRLYLNLSLTRSPLPSRRFSIFYSF